MQLIAMPLIVRQVRRKLLQVGEIIGAAGIYTFVDSKMLSIFFGLKNMTAIRASQNKRRRSVHPGSKALAADLALELAFAAVVVIDVGVRGVTARAGGIFGDGPAIAAIDRH